MGSMTIGADRSDVVETSYLSVVVSVGTSQVEAKVGSSHLSNRQLVVLYNDSNTTLYYGPSGVTTSGSTKGIPIAKGQTVAVSIGNASLFLIAGSSSNSVIVQEMS